MQAKPHLYMLTALALLTVGCSGNDEPRLMHLRSSGNGPDEFGILPPKPLQMPTDMAALPAPTPNGQNLTDPTPEADAITALGGRPGAGGNDQALVAYTTRHGVGQNIRGQLGGEDLNYRRNNDGRLLERLFGVNVYYRAYEPMSLDQQQELAKWRRKGVATPSAPPKK